MKIPFLKKLLANRRGISMAEVVVSLTMIVMITAAAISVVVASIQFETKYINEVTALRNCESIAACVRYADSDETLASLLKELGFVPHDAEDAEGKYTYTMEADADDPNLHKYTLVQGSYKIILKANFTTNKYDISAVNENGDEIY